MDAQVTHLFRKVRVQQTQQFHKTKFNQAQKNWSVLYSFLQKTKVSNTYPDYASQMETVIQKGVVMLQILRNKIKTNFVNILMKAIINREVSFEGEYANVPIKFGPGASKDETMKCVKKDNKWFFYSF